MNTIDILLLTIIGYNAFAGFRRGLVRLVMDFVAFGVAIALTRNYGAIAAKFVEQTIHQHPPTSTLVGYIGLWLVTFGILSLIGMWISAALPMIGLSTLNRMGGLVGGTAKGLLFCIPILMPMQFFKQDLLVDSMIAQALSPAITTIGARIFPKP